MAKTIRTLFDITYREDIDNVIRELNPQEYAYILHDSDKLLNGEEKKKHFHIWCRWENPQRNETIAKILQLNDKHNCCTAKSQKACIRYMTHETKDAIKLGKFRYDRNMIISNLEKDELARIFLLTENDPDKINSILQLIEQYKSELNNGVNVEYNNFILDLCRLGYIDIFNKYYNSIFCKMVRYWL